MKIIIKARFSDAILFEGEYESTRHAAEAAVKSGADLRGADLYCTNLRGADLYGASLRGADLRGADLYCTNLRGADLYGASLRGTNLRGADLYGASLRGASLRGTNLRGADLRGTNLRGADLYGADLRGTNLRGADLYGASLRGADLRGTNLRGADLRGADLYGADLRGADGEKIATIKSALQVGPVGSRKDYTTAIETDKGIYVNAGCFFGTFDEFKAKVKKSHKSGQFAAEYEAVIAMISSVFNARKDVANA